MTWAIKKVWYNQHMKIFDGHNDTLTRFLEDSHADRTFFTRSDEGDLDSIRAKEGELSAGIFAIFTPPPLNSPESEPHWGLSLSGEGYTMKLPSPLSQSYAKDYSDKTIDYAFQLERESGGMVRVIKTYAELEQCFSEDLLGMVLHIEGAEALEPDLSNLENYYHKGIRSIGITWSRPNAFGYGVPFAYPRSPDTGEGLTKAGRELVKMCNRIGILIDLAHLNLRGFFDVARITDKPLVVSHAGVYSICSSTRNVTDEQLQLIKESNGLVGIMFEPINTRRDGKPEKNSTLMEIVYHIEYIAEKIGVEYVGFGSDFDGADMPVDLKDASKMQNLINALRDRGVSDEALEKFAYKNWLRVIKDTWKD